MAVIEVNIVNIHSKYSGVKAHCNSQILLLPTAPETKLVALLPEFPVHFAYFETVIYENLYACDNRMPALSHRVPPR